MNIESMIKAADFLEKLPDHKFDMGTWACNKGQQPFTGSMNHPHIPPAKLNHLECKTAACLAGWTVYLLGDETQKAQRFSIEKNAAEILNLSRTEADYLFMGKWKPGKKDLDEITRDDVVQHLRKCIADGKII